MDRRTFLKFLGSLSVFSLPPVRALLSPLGEEKRDSLTPEQLDALEKIRYFEAQLEQQNGRFSWYLHNELRHYWGAFSEAKSLAHADIVLEHSIMDPYILNTLSDWYYAPKYDEPFDPELALASLRRRAENYPELPYVGAACWLKAGEISAAIGDRSLARDCYQQVMALSGKSGNYTSRLAIYQHLAQSQLMAGS